MGGSETVRRFRIRVDGQVFEVEAEEILEQAPNDAVERDAPSLPANPAIEGRDDVLTVVAPLPGTVLEIRVSQGQPVVTGQLLVILEAMKMENEITSPRAGHIVQVVVDKGQAVAFGDPLLIVG